MFIILVKHWEQNQTNYNNLIGVVCCLFQTIYDIDLFLFKRIILKKIVHNDMIDEYRLVTQKQKKPSKKAQSKSFFNMSSIIFS